MFLEILNFCFRFIICASQPCYTHSLFLNLRTEMKTFRWEQIWDVVCISFFPNYSWRVYSQRCVHSYVQQFVPQSIQFNNLCGVIRQLITQNQNCTLTNYTISCAISDQTELPINCNRLHLPGSSPNRHLRLHEVTRFYQHPRLKCSSPEANAFLISLILLLSFVYKSYITGGLI
jgi:hypothetical protein